MGKGKTKETKDVTEAKPSGIRAPFHGDGAVVRGFLQKAVQHIMVATVKDTRIAGGLSVNRHLY